LLMAAALSQPSIDVLDARAILRAKTAGIVNVDERGRVTFTHPLLASAVYGAARADRRREVHRDLAARVTNAEERARHLALATDGPNEEVAAALMEAARSARGRGAPDASIELVELACDLTPPEDRETFLARRFELGRNLASAGDPHRAMSVLRALAAQAPPGPVRARALLLLGFLSEWADGSVIATGICEEALVAAGDDIELRAEIHAAASRICDHDTERKRSHARAALELTERGTAGSRLRAYALLAFAEAEFKAGQGILDEVFEEASRLELAEEEAHPARTAQRSHTVHLYSDLRPSDRLLSILRVYADEFEPARVVLEKERRAVTDHGDDAQLARTLGRLATVELRAGNWDLAERRIREMSKVAERTGEGVVAHRRLTLEAELAALRGDLASARTLAAEALATAESAGWPWETAQALAALGFLDLTQGDARSAREHFDRLDASYRAMGFGEPGLFRHQADHVEALIAAGEVGRAEEALERFEEQGLSSGRNWALAAAARCRGLLRSAAGDLDGALRALETAIAAHDAVSIPFELARTLMVKGQIHRRRKEKLLARDALARSVEIFEQLGSRLWAERARAELDRVGSRRTDRHDLTVTEERVASLAASGLTNRVIAERAFLSPKTVEANLARVYQKLGINSRAQLGRAMAERERATAK
jgi:DNA-binding CsgD family transcriptional regulator